MCVVMRARTKMVTAEMETSEKNEEPRTVSKKSGNTANAPTFEL